MLHWIETCQNPSNKLSCSIPTYDRNVIKQRKRRMVQVETKLFDECHDYSDNHFAQLLNSFHNKWLHNIDGISRYIISIDNKSDRFYAIESDNGNNYLPCQPMIKSRMRGIVTKWLFNVGSKYHLSNLTVHIAISHDWRFGKRSYKVTGRE